MKFEIFFKKRFKIFLNMLVDLPYPYTISSPKDNEAARRRLRRRIYRYVEDAALAG
jgi:hypothetical protein